MVEGDYVAVSSHWDDPPGLCLLDIGCSRTMHGLKWKSSFLAQPGVPEHREAVHHRSFHGIGGLSTSLTLDTFAIGLFGCNGEVESVCLEQDIPMLLSREDMRTLGFHLHMPSDTLDIEAFGIFGAPVIVTRAGNIAISLLDYAPGGHPGISGWRISKSVFSRSAKFVQCGLSGCSVDSACVRHGHLNMVCMHRPRSRSPTRVGSDSSTPD